MATIVMHIESETNYVLLGTGFGLWAVSEPGFMGFNNRDQGEYPMLFVSDEQGAVRALKPDQVVVVSVDGRSPADLLGGPPQGRQIG